MILMRIIGAIIVIGASTAAGIYYGNIETYRLRDLLEFKKALAILRSQIEYARTPLPEATRLISVRVRESVGNVFAMFADLLTLQRNEQVADLWAAAVETHGDGLFLSQEDTERLKAFGAQLGDLDSGAQVMNISMLIDYIDDCAAQLQESRGKNRKLYQSLGVLGGALLVIIFI